MKEVEQLALDVVTNLKEIQKQLKISAHRQFLDVNITGPQGIMLFILIHHGQLKISEISEKMGLTNSTVSGIVDRLETMNFVERIRSDKDRRVVYVKATEIIGEKFKQHEASMDSLLLATLQSMDLSEAIQIAQSIRKLNERIHLVNEGETHTC